MGLINAFSDWRENRKEKKRADMEAKGFCPDCGGRGFNVVAHSEAYYIPPMDCFGCDGSGLYSDWERNQFS
ncbi:methionine aminopeptidase [Salinibacillus xinjiangensis]|uniref:Methionine aminopeptidase n=1 Tax=Salinibacillus xinjiangensis TaxID=1229268 RepID=A0A6G1X3V6_9BACI|nr:methionine aminopeptidase [Salinibacillus xinjiangensis]MRG85673.1 methionine aminopeptidase [Salinibacillus xinjiangensis]